MANPIVTFSPFAGAGAQFFDNNGVPLAGGLLYTYASGTTTQQATYTNSSGAVANSNPIVLNSSGRTPQEIWLLNGYSYKFVLQTATASQIGSYDGIPYTSTNLPIINDANSISYEQGTSTTAGNFIVGSTYLITSIGTTNFTTIGAASNTVGILFTATGVGTGTGTAQLSINLQNKLQQTISIKDFGATGNGTTDDTTAIQNAFIAVAGTRTALYMPAGTYKITQPINVTEGGLGYGGLVYGDGYATNIVYYPPANATSPAIPSSINGYGIFNAGAFNFGNDNFQGFGMQDFRITLGGSNQNGACGLKASHWYQGYIRNVNINGFACGIHISYGWSSTVEQCKIYNCTYGIAWDNITIGTIRGCDIATCNLGIYFGWNIFNTDTSGGTLFAQSVTIAENTLQSCKESAIVGMNVAVCSITGTYTEANCAGPYTNLSSSSVLNSTAYNGAEVIFVSSNVDGNSRISITSNWFYNNLASVPYILGLNKIFGLYYANNDTYSVTEYLAGRKTIEIVATGNLSDLTFDSVAKISGSYTYDQAINFYGASHSTLPSNNYASLTGTGTINFASLNQVSTLLFPVQLTESIGFSNINISSAGESGYLSYRVTVYQNYIGSITQTDVLTATGSYNSGINCLTLTLPNTFVLPAGTSFIGLEITNTYNGANSFTYASLTGFNYTKGDMGVAYIASAFPGAVSNTNVSSVLQPAQIFLS